MRGRDKLLYHILHGIDQCSEGRYAHQFCRQAVHHSLFTRKGHRPQRIPLGTGMLLCIGQCDGSPLHIEEAVGNGSAKFVIHKTPRLAGVEVMLRLLGDTKRGVRLQRLRSPLTGG